MKDLTIGAAQKLTSPNPFGLVTVKKEDGSVNVMAVSWWNYVSNHPASLAVCLSKKGFSGGCIVAQKGFSLSLPGEALAAGALACGTCSGRDRDKAAEFGIPITVNDDFPQGMVDGSRVCFSCTLSQCCDMGDHILYVGEIQKIVGDENVSALYARNGYGELTTVQ